MYCRFQQLSTSFLRFCIALSCTCKDLVVEDKYGNCKSASDKVPKFHGNTYCYVVQPSSCNDLFDATKGAPEKSSAQACSSGNCMDNTIM